MRNLNEKKCGVGKFPKTRPSGFGGGPGGCPGRLKLILIAFAGLFASCITDFDTVPKPEEATDPYAISVEEALDGMYDLMEDIYGPETRAATRQVASVETIKSSRFAGETRCSETYIPDDSRLGIDDLIYVINFENDEGYAILGADKRVSSMLCLTEAGSFTAAEIERIAMEQGNQTRATDSTGDTSEAYTEELIVSSGENGAFIKSLLVGQIIDEMESIVAIDPSDLEVMDDVVCGGQGNVPYRGSDEGGVIVYDEWRTVRYHSFKPLLTTKWNQGNPYNMWCPNRYSAGCVAIALAQIVACNEWPAPSTIYYNVTLSWKEIKAYNYNSYGGSIPQPGFTGYRESDQLATIIKIIGDEVDMNYSANGSGASTSKAKKYLEKYYSQVDRITLKYDQKAVIKMLSRKRPVYIASNQGHAWVIDGSMHQKRYRYIYINGQQSTTIDERTLVHCNFGWGGTSDGYYEQKLFKAHDGPVEREPGVDNPADGNHSQKDANYTRSFNIITYQ